LYCKKSVLIMQQFCTRWAQAAAPPTCVAAAEIPNARNGAAGYAVTGYRQAQNEKRALQSSVQTI
jgi:hypothetical protein